MDRMYLVASVIASLPASGHSHIYQGRCDQLTHTELVTLSTHLTSDRIMGHTAVCWQLGSWVDDTTCAQYQHSDVLCVVWRNGWPATFFFTRTPQVNRGHLRVKDIMRRVFTLSGKGKASW